jgi:hypothetical protein
MSKVFLLLKAEITRLIKYKIILFGLLVTLIWLVLLSVVNKEEAKTLLPQLLVFDTGLMTIILLASSYFFEKQELNGTKIFLFPFLIFHSFANFNMINVNSSLLSIDRQK